MTFTAKKARLKKTTKKQEVLCLNEKEIFFFNMGSSIFPQTQ